jgi:hypothetical protein
MPTTTTYFVYWDPKGAPAFPAGYKSAITAFFKGLAHDNGTDKNFYSVLTQYGLKYETHLGKAITDKHPYPAESSECAERPSTPCVSDVQIKAELGGLVKEHKLPGQVFEHDQSPAGEGPTHSYFVLLPPGVSNATLRESNQAAVLTLGSVARLDSFAPSTTSPSVWETSPNPWCTESCHMCPASRDV